MGWTALDSISSFCGVWPTQIPNDSLPQVATSCASPTAPGLQRESCSSGTTLSATSRRKSEVYMGTKSLSSLQIKWVGTPDWPHIVIPLRLQEQHWNAIQRCNSPGTNLRKHKSNNSSVYIETKHFWTLLLILHTGHISPSDDSAVFNYKFLKLPPSYGLIF